jgi:histone deacetylase 6
LELVHSKGHVEEIINMSFDLKDNESDEVERIGGDVYLNKYSADCALLSAGGTIEGIKSLLDSKECNAVFAAVRPPGHHASHKEAAGFCFFNNVAVAAKYAQSKYGVKKVCIFDWDIHCGDGTSKLFDKDDSILLVSMHRYDDGMFYPGGKIGSYENIG